VRIPKEIRGGNDVEKIRGIKWKNNEGKNNSCVFARTSTVPKEKFCRNKSPPLPLSLALSLSLLLFLYHQLRITYQVGGRGKGDL